MNKLLGGGCLIGICRGWPAIGVDQDPISNSTEFNFVVGTEDTTPRNRNRYGQRYNKDTMQYGHIDIVRTTMKPTIRIRCKYTHNSLEDCTSDDKLLLTNVIVRNSHSTHTASNIITRVDGSWYKITGNTTVNNEAHTTLVHIHSKLLITRPTDTLNLRNCV